MRLEWCRESNVASGRRAHRTRLRILAIPKYFSDVEKGMILWVAWHYLRILYILAYPKSKWSLHPSYTVSHSVWSKIRLCLVRERGFLALTMHIILSGLSKMWLDGGRETNVEREPFAYFFALWLTQNTILTRSKKQWYNGLPRTNSSYYTFWPLQNATWVRSRNQCSKLSPRISQIFSTSGYSKFRL